MKTVDDDKLTVCAGKHEAFWGSRTGEVGGKDDNFLTKKGEFGLWEALKGDNFAKSGLSGVGFWCELRHGFGEFGSESGLGVILGDRGWKVGEVLN